MKFFEWCLKEKIKNNPKLVELIVERINELIFFDKKTLWGTLAEGNPNATVKKSIDLIKEDDKTETTRRVIGSCLEEIKRKLYNIGKKETCIEFYNILYNWLKNEDFITISDLSDETLRSYSKNRVLRIIHEIIEQIRGWKSTFNQQNIERILKKYPHMYSLIWKEIQKLLKDKEYHPLLTILEYAHNKDHRAFYWSIEILNKIEYYFNNYPKIKNGKYSKSNDIVRFMIANLFSEYYGFISEVFVFEKLHNAGVILICEPNVGNKHPDYLIQINGKEIIIEVKNFMLSEDILISGSGSDMRKFSLDLNEAFKQTVPIDNPKYPVILALDSGRSFIEEDLIHDEFHGSLTFVWHPDKPEKEGDIYRKKDYLASKKKLATYLQGIILFKTKMIENKLHLLGSFTEHIHREKFLDKEDFDLLNKILFTQYS